MQPRDITRHTVSAFLQTTSGWTDEQRRAFAERYCTERDDVGDEAWRVPFPLIDQLLYPTLMEWAREDTDPRPHRWLALHLGQYLYKKLPPGAQRDPILVHLERAIDIDPQEQPARIELVRRRIDAIAFAAHHLPDDYIGDPNESIDAAQDIPALIKGIHDPQTRAQLQDWLAYELQLIADWQQFTAEGEKDFSAWCHAQGRNYHWVRSYYFERARKDR